MTLDEYEAKIKALRMEIRIALWERQRTEAAERAASLQVGASFGVDLNKIFEEGDK